MELNAIQEKRAGLEDAIAAKAEELKKKIVYLKKQLHYKGGYDAHEEYKLADAIEALVGEFDHAVAEIRAWFSTNVENEIGQSTARANTVGEAFSEAVQRLMEIQAALSSELAMKAREGAIATEEAFAISSQERLEAFKYVVHALTEKVGAWYEEKLHWIGGLHDHYYAEDLTGKLSAKKDQALAALHDRANAAQEVIDYRREELGARLGELIGKFDQTANDELQALADSSAAEVASLAGEVQATADGFASAANFENNGINAFLDDLVKQWVWWLKQYYGYGGYAASYYEGYEEVHAGETHYGGNAGHDAAHDPAYDQHDPAAYDPHKLAGYAEIEAFFKRDFVGDLPETKHGLLHHIDQAADEAEALFAQYEDNAEGALEHRRGELQAKLVGQREDIEHGLAEAQNAAKANIVEQRDAFIYDVTDKRAAVEDAIQQLQEQHYGDDAHSDKRALLYEIHEAKEAFATAVQDARTQFDLVLSTARDASETRLAAAREQFETDLQRKRADLDQQITALRTDLANQAAAKREALGLELGAAWEDMEEAIEEKVHAFKHAVEQKLVWINKVRYYGLRHKLLEAVKELQAVFADDIAGLRQMFADQAEERRLAADAAITATQDEFEVFVSQVVATCDANRADQSTKLEWAIGERRTAFDELLGECRKAISWAIDAQIKALKDFL
jgi:hypothetical protein